MTTIACPDHEIETEIFEIEEEGTFIDDNANKNAIFKSMKIPKRTSLECNDCEWLINKTTELYNGD